MQIATAKEKLCKWTQEHFYSHALNIVDAAILLLELEQFLTLV